MRRIAETVDVRRDGTCEGRIRELVGPEFDRGRAQGRGLRPDDAVSIALE
jgi:hypothetical protein